MISRDLLNHMNTLWPVLIVSELAKNGIRTYFVSPGNRNVPIIAALAATDGVCVKFCMDERAAAYQALGHAKSAGEPGVLVCTSGTAAANYYPALIEAHRDAVPMIVWSADRPPELSCADANQTIEQQDLYGRFAVKRLNLPCPSVDYPVEALLSMICDLAGVKNGPVHINLPFREPLLPASGCDPAAVSDQDPSVRGIMDILNNPYPYTRYVEAAGYGPAAAPAGDPVVSRVAEMLGGCKRGLVVAGRLTPPEDPEMIVSFAEKRQWPVFCDIASGIKGHFSEAFEIPFFDHPEAARLVLAYDPEVIVQFGTGLVSKAYYDIILEGNNRPPVLIQVTPKKGVRDPAHRVDFKMAMTAREGIMALERVAYLNPDAKAVLKLASGFETLVREIGRSTPEDRLSHPLIAKMIFGLIPGNEALFTGNSLVIRAFDMAVPPAGKKLDVVSNRGVSGIEGNIATGVGFAESSGKRTTVVLGDLSLLHDLNSLMLAARSRIPVIVIAINNSGGRIFERLPVADFDGIPEGWVTTPHQYTFEMAAGQFNLPYQRAGTPEELIRAYESALGKHHSAFIEISLFPDEDLNVFHMRRNAGIGS